VRNYLFYYLKGLFFFMSGTQHCVSASPATPLSLISLCQTASSSEGRTEYLPPTPHPDRPF